jgi:glycosyltransferase involved in cell wall biosynthesis
VPLSQVPIPQAPRVSVICAAWNGERFIGQTLDAFKAQDEPNFEVIVVDDASTDTTPQLLASIDDPRFRIIRNATNLRVIESRNIAVRAARAPFIAVTDQDDPSQRSRLRLQANYLDQHPKASAVATLIRSIDSDGNLRRGVSDWSFSGEEARAAFVFHNFLSHSTLMFRRQYAPEPVYPPEQAYCEDYRLLVALADQGEGIHVIRKKLVDYRYHDTNHTHVVRSDMAQASRQIRLELLARMDVLPTDAQWRLHQGFEGSPAAINASVHRESGLWLTHLINANRRSAYVERAAFERVCAYKWLELTHRFSGLGRVCWAQFKKGPVSALSQMPALWPSIANLFRKTCLKA